MIEPIAGGAPPIGYRRIAAGDPAAVADREVRAAFGELIGLRDAPAPGSVPVEVGRWLS